MIVSTFRKYWNHSALKLEKFGKKKEPEHDEY